MSVSAVAGDSTWTPNQEAVRTSIAAAAGRLVAREGLSACTVRAVAAEAGLTKSRVHYYVVDTNELVDLGVGAFLDDLAAYSRAQVLEAADPSAALAALVRIFTGREPLPMTLQDPTLWSSYTTHAWKRDAAAEVVRCLDTFSSLFRQVLEQGDVAGADWRARSIHHYLLGAVQRQIVDPLQSTEVAAAVSALADIEIDPDDLDHRGS